MEDLGDARDDLLPGDDQRVRRNGLLIGLPGGAHDGFDGLALAAPDHGAGLQHGGIRGEIGDDEARIEGAHLAGLILADQELHAVLAGASVTPASQLMPRWASFSAPAASSFTLMKSHVAHHALAVVLNLTEEIEMRLT
jgi:hypothetical protein